jgi:hypothetical protein
MGMCCHEQTNQIEYIDNSSPNNRMLYIDSEDDELPELVDDYNEFSDSERMPELIEHDLVNLRFNQYYIFDNSIHYDYNTYYTYYRRDIETQQEEENPAEDVPEEENDIDENSPTTLSYEINLIVDAMNSIRDVLTNRH